MFLLSQMASSPQYRRGRRHRRRRRRLGARIADRQLDQRGGVAHRIEHGQVILADLHRAINQTVRVDRRIPPIGRRLVVEVRFRVGPVPLGDDDVSLLALGPRRRRWHFAGGNAIGPVRKRLENPLPAETVERAAHPCACLSGLHAPIPRGHGRRKIAQRFRDFARRLVAQLVAAPAAAVLQTSQPLRLAAHGWRDAVALVARSGELVLPRHVDKREPVAGRVVFCCRTCVGRDNRLQVQHLAGRALHLGRIHEPVAAHPHVVGGFRKIGHDVASLIVRDHDLHELRLEARRFGDDPDADLRPFRAGHGSADVVVINGDGRAR